MKCLTSIEKCQHGKEVNFRRHVLNEVWKDNVAIYFDLQQREQDSADPRTDT
jgi:hypothetical protein